MMFPSVGGPEALTGLTPTFRNVSVMVIVTMNRAKSLVLNSKTQIGTNTRIEFLRLGIITRIIRTYSTYSIDCCVVIVN